MGNTSSSSAIIAQLRDPLIPNLSRRNSRKRKIKVPAVSQVIIPSHIQKCLEYHKVKPWLEKKVSVVLAAFPQRNTAPPLEQRAFLTSVPYHSLSPREAKEIRDKGQDYIWYTPSELLWKLHCFIQHQQQDLTKCDITGPVRSFNYNNQQKVSFVFGVVFTDNTFRILDEEDYRKECAWWEKFSAVTGGIGERKMILKNSPVDAASGQLARRLMTSKIQEIYQDLGKDITTQYASQVEEIFYKSTVNSGRLTTYDYVENCLRILIFADPTSPLARYTLAFRKRLINGYYSLSVLPSLTIKSIFPVYYGIQQTTTVDDWISSYLRDQIEEFFTTLITRLDPSIRKPNTKTFDIEVPVDIVTSEEMCPDIPPEDVVVYKEDDNIYCFTVQQLLERKSDINPYTGRNIARNFLEEFDNEFRDIKTNHSRSPDKKCAMCHRKVKQYVAQTGSIDASGNTEILGFCSAECLETSKDIEAELFGDAESIDFPPAENKEAPVPKITVTNETRLTKLKEKEGKLQDKINSLEEKITGLNNKAALAEILSEKSNQQQALLESKEEEIKELQRKIQEEPRVEDVNNLSALEEEIRQIRQTAIDYQRELKQKLEIINQDEMKISQYETEINNLRTQLEKVNQQAEKNRAQQAAVYEDMQQELIRAERKRTELENEVLNLQKTNLALAQAVELDNNQIVQQAAQYQAEIARISQREKELQEIISAEKLASQQRQEELTRQLQAQIDRMTDDHNQIIQTERAAADKLRASIEEERKIIEEQRTLEKLQYQQAVEQLTQQYNDSFKLEKAAGDQLRAKIEMERAAIETIRAQLAQDNREDMERLNRLLEEDRAAQQVALQNEQKLRIEIESQRQAALQATQKISDDAAEEIRRLNNQLILERQQREVVEQEAKELSDAIAQERAKLEKTNEQLDKEYTEKMAALSREYELTLNLEKAEGKRAREEISEQRDRLESQRKEEIKQFEEQIVALNQALLVAQTENARLFKQQESTRNALEEERRQMEEMKASYLRRAEAEAETLKNQCNVAIQLEKNERDRLMAEEAKLRDSLTAERQATERVKIELQQKVDQIMGLQKRVDSLLTESAKVARLENELKNLQASATSSATNARIQELEEQIAKAAPLQLALQVSQEKLAQLQSEVNTLRNSCISTNTIQDYEAKIKTLLENIDNKKNTINDLTHTLQKADQERQKWLARDVDGEMNRIKDAYQALLLKKDEELQTTLKKQEDEFKQQLERAGSDKYDSLLQKREEEIKAQFRSEISRLKSDLDRADTAVQEAMEAKRDIENRLTSCRNNDALARLREEYEETSKRFQRELQDYKLQRDEYKERIESLQRELDSARETCDSLKHQQPSPDTDLNNAIKKIEILLGRVTV